MIYKLHLNKAVTLKRKKNYLIVQTIWQLSVYINVFLLFAPRVKQNSNPLFKTLKLSNIFTKCVSISLFGICIC